MSGTKLEKGGGGEGERECPQVESQFIAWVGKRGGHGQPAPSHGVT